MNIAIDVRSLMNAKTSGVTLFLRKLMPVLQGLDKQNRYILYCNAFKKIDLGLGGNLKEFKIIKTRLPNKILNLLLFFFGKPWLNKWIERKTGEKIDVFFEPDLRPVAVSRGVKKILTLHDISWKRFPKFFSFRSRVWHKILNPKKEIKTADVIVAVSEFTKKELMNEFKVRENKIKVIYHGVDLKFQDEKFLKNVKLKFGLPEKFVFTISTLEPRKNIHGLIEAYEKLASGPDFDYDLVIAGEQNERIFKKIALKNHQRIHFIGFLSEEEKAALYQLADVFCFVSFYEGFGLPVLEAMKMKCPVVASNRGALSEILGGNGILVDPYDILGIGFGIRKALSGGKKSDLIKKAYERAGEFTWEKCARGYIELING